MFEVNKEWALKKLKEYLQLVKLYSPNSSGSGIYVIGSKGVLRSSMEEVYAQTHVIEKILDQVIPDWRNISVKPNGPLMDRERQATIRAISELENKEETQKNLGDGAPSVDIGKLHPWVWDAARSLWNSGHYRESVSEVAKKVNAETQNKCSRKDVAEADLFNQLFSSDEPKAGKPRLRIRPFDGSKTPENLTRGARSFAEGLYVAIRNPLAHEIQDLPQHEALEQLAAFSILARWVDNAELIESTQR
jgi:hypothetical protein